MSEYKKGDRVKVTIDGFVGQPYKTGFTVHSIDHVYVATVAEHPNVTIEKLADPLPTTPGSVINFGSIYRMLASDGKWYRPGVADGARPETLVLNYRVLHDAGEAS